MIDVFAKCTDCQAEASILGGPRGAGPPQYFSKGGKGRGKGEGRGKGGKVKGPSSL